MILKVISTGSQKGNCYALISESEEILLLDFGCDGQSILRGINYKISNVVGAVLSHEHGDHSKSYDWILRNGIPVYTNDKTAEHFETIFNAKMVKASERVPFKLLGYTIIPFYVPHDGCPCSAFLIHHRESGYTLYATDMSRIAQVDENYRLKIVSGKPVDWSFKSLGLSHMIIEANYDFNDFGNINEFKRSHVGFGHHSLQACRRFVEDNKTALLRNVFLCHLSSETDSDHIKREMKKSTGKWINVDVCQKGKIWELNKCPF